VRAPSFNRRAGSGCATEADDFDAVRANLFPAAHGFIGDWPSFPWHRDRRQQIQTHKLQSSQALALDVFGTIHGSAVCDAILDAVARLCGLRQGSPWTLAPEWTDPQCLLAEPKLTQVDAIAFGAQSIILFEGKFGESGGPCSQPGPLLRGRHKGKRQCNGNYEVQTNPVNGSQARCALSAKGIRYWELIPDVFAYDRDATYRPCPFAADKFQWMRNLVLAQALGRASGKQTAVVVAYADARGLATADHIRTESWHAFRASLRPSSPPLVEISYQALVALAASVAGTTESTMWRNLAAWVDRKIQSATLPVST